MSSEGAYKKSGPEIAEKKGEAFKEKEVMGEMKKEHAYTSHAKKLSTKEIFGMISGFKKKWVKGLLSVLKKLLG